MPWRGLEWRFGFQVNFTKASPTAPRPTTAGQDPAIIARPPPAKASQTRPDQHQPRPRPRPKTNPPLTTAGQDPATLARPPPTASQPASRPSPDHHRPRPPRPRPLSTQPKPAKPNPSQPTAGTGPKTNRQPPRPAALFGFAGYALQGLGDVDEEVAHLFEGVEDV